jgi:hypothetical protein
MESSKLDELYKYIVELETQVTSNCLKGDMEEYQINFQWGYTNALRMVKNKIIKMKEEE